MKLLFLITFIFVTPALACSVSLPEKLLVLGENSGPSTIIHPNNCTEEVLNDLSQILLTTEGRIAAYQIKEMMLAKNHHINVTPNSITVQNLKSLVRDQLMLPAGVHMKSIQAENSPSILSLSAGDRVEISCSSCLNGVNSSMNITIFRFDGTSQSLFARADFKKMVKAYRLVSPLASFQQLKDPQILKEEYVEEIPQTDLISDRDSLSFFITNKPLKAGELLRRSDLNAVNLVRAGTKTDVILENQMVRIKTQGISRANGSIGDFVEVYHPQKNKKYHGKVVDLNKVLVEL